MCHRYGLGAYLIHRPARPRFTLLVGASGDMWRLECTAIRVPGAASLADCCGTGASVSEADGRALSGECI